MGKIVATTAAVTGRTRKIGVSDSLTKRADTPATTEAIISPMARASAATNQVLRIRRFRRASSTGSPWPPARFESPPLRRRSSRAPIPWLFGGFSIWIIISGLPRIDCGIPDGRPDSRRKHKEGPTTFLFDQSLDFAIPFAGGLRFVSDRQKNRDAMSTTTGEQSSQRRKPSMPRTNRRLNGMAKKAGLRSPPRRERLTRTIALLNAALQLWEAKQPRSAAVWRNKAA
jgi:hypothetical protein